MNRRDALKLGVGATLAASVAPGIGTADKATQQDRREGFYLAGLTGTQQVPIVRTEANGGALFNFDPQRERLRYTLSVNNLESLMQAHIHRGTEGRNGPVVAWLYPGPFARQGRLRRGASDGVIAESTITAENLVGPLRGEPLGRLARMIERGEAYVNVHTRRRPQGEIRGQIVSPQSIAEAFGFFGGGGGTTTTTTTTTTEDGGTETTDGFGTTDTTDGFGTTTDGFGTTDTTDGFGTTDTTDGFGTTDTTEF